MSWWGKLIGGTVGFTMGGPLGALLGGFLGHKFVDKSSFIGKFKQIEYTQAAFFTATFTVMGHIAKADGHVSKDEINMARQIMAHMNLNSEQKKAAIALFNQGKAADFDLDAVMQQFKQVARRKTNLMQMFIEIQLHAIYADGKKAPVEHKILVHLANILGFSRHQLNHLEAMVQSNLNAMSGDSRLSIEEQLTEAYQLLDISPSASDNEVKKAYRRMMSQHHPDKLVSKGLPEEMMKMANEKTQQIKKAYDLIKKIRSEN
ncbi:MAG: co-chaperone DjlA [Pseudomonadota bacterium]